MCTLKTWYSDTDGCIRQCRECHHFQVIFGTTMLTLQDEEFETFLGLVNSRLGTLVPGQEDIKQIILPTPCPGMNVILSGRELCALNTMLQQVDNERVAVALLDLFR